MDKAFFKPEIRSGFLVSSERKKLWAIQLDLLQQLDNICTKYGLKYFAQGGTLLGAVRHKGFIPWDDDADIVMLWDDYQTLLKVAPEYFQAPYFFQSYLSEPEAEPTFSRLRNSDTTGCTKFELECITPAFNKGIFIDIFPLFNVPDSEEDRIKQREEIGYWWKLYKGYEVHREKQLNGFSMLSADYEPYEKLYLDLDPRPTFAELKQQYTDACCSEAHRTEYVAPLSYRSNNPKTTWPRKWFDEQVRLPFEDITLPCPAAYLDMLEHQFGQWQIPVNNPSVHEEIGLFDADVPFEQKLNGMYVREYFSSDFEALSKLLKEAYDSNVTREELESHYLSNMNHILIAMNANTLAGCAFFSVTDDYIRRKHTAFVSYVAVNPNCRRLGVGTALLEEIEKQVKGYGCTAIELTSADFRTEAHAFYKARGFARKKTTVFIKELEE